MLRIGSGLGTLPLVLLILFVSLMADLGGCSISSDSSAVSLILVLGGVLNLPSDVNKETKLSNLVIRQ